MFAPGKQKLAVVRKLLNAIVFAVLSDVIATIGVLGHVGNKLKFAVSIAALAADCLLIEQFAHRGIREYAKIVRIANQQIAGIIE